MKRSILICLCILSVGLLAAQVRAQSLWMPHTTANTIKPVPNFDYGLYDSDHSHVYRFLMTGDATAERDISWDFGDAARTITVSGDTTLSGTNTGDDPMDIGDAVGSGTTGSVLFVGSGPVLAQDNAGLFFDPATNQLGVNDNTLVAQLDILSAETDRVGLIVTPQVSSTVDTFQVHDSAGVSVFGVDKDGFIQGKNVGDYIDINTYYNAFVWTVAGTSRATFQLSNDNGTPIIFSWRTGNIEIVRGSKYPVYFFDGASSGLNEEIRIYGYPTGGAKDYASFQMTGTTTDLTISTNRSGSDINLAPDTDVNVTTGNVIAAQGAVATTPDSTTLGVAATTLAVDTCVVTLTGDGGGNTVATITGGVSGQLLTIICVDALVTITDTDAHTANTVDLVGTATDFTSADDTVLQLVFNGTSWYETSRSAN